MAGKIKTDGSDLQMVKNAKILAHFLASKSGFFGGGISAMYIVDYIFAICCIHCYYIFLVFEHNEWLKIGLTAAAIGGLYFAVTSNDAI